MITLAVLDIPAVSTESHVLYWFIIKVRMDTHFFYFHIFFWYQLIQHISFGWKIFGSMFKIFQTWFHFVFRSIIFNSRLWYCLTRYRHKNHCHLSWYQSNFEKVIAVNWKKIINYFIFIFKFSIYLLANTHSTLRCPPGWMQCFLKY